VHSEVIKELNADIVNLAEVQVRFGKHPSPSSKGCDLLSQDCDVLAQLNQVIGPSYGYKEYLVKVHVEFISSSCMIIFLLLLLFYI
jgi:hypothetical protein